MEHHAVVKAAFGQFGDPLDMAGRQIGAQLDDDIAALSVAAIEGEGELFKTVYLVYRWVLHKLYKTLPKLMFMYPASALVRYGTWKKEVAILDMVSPNMKAQ